MLVVNPLPVLAAGDTKESSAYMEETEMTTNKEYVGENESVNESEESDEKTETHQQTSEAEAAETESVQESTTEGIETSESIDSETDPFGSSEHNNSTEESTEKGSETEAVSNEEEKASQGTDPVDPGQKTPDESTAADSLEGETAAESAQETEEEDDGKEEYADPEKGSTTESTEIQSSPEMKSEESRPAVVTESETVDSIQPGIADSIKADEKNPKESKADESETETAESVSESADAETTAEETAADETVTEESKAENKQKEKVSEDTSPMFLFETPSIPEYYPVINLYEEFRFTQIRNPEPIIIKAHSVVYTDTNTQSEIVAVSYGQNLGVRIEKTDTYWSYIECGQVRGFIRNKEIITGKIAERYWKQTHHNNSGLQLTAVADQQSNVKGFMFEKISPMDNPALTYTHTTGNDVIMEPVYGIAVKDIQIKDATVVETALGRTPQDVGTMKAGDLCCIIANVYDSSEWFVESGDVRGFVSKTDIDISQAVQKKVETEEEEGFSTAEEIIKPKDNRALYYSLASVKKAQENTGRAIIEYALQFVGSPYVFGGNSLTNGIDCSGFVQQVYAHFGYRLPRTSLNIRSTGRYVGTSLRDAQMGDIICYDGHVALYLGNGQIVHASNSKPYPRGGVKVSRNAAYRKILAIRRIIE